MTDWTAVSAIATGAGAFATGAATIFIAIQTNATRRAVEVSERSIAVGQEGLKVSSLMAAEALKARLDARAPSLHVVAAPSHNEAARHKADVEFGQIGRAWPRDREFRRDGDDHQYLTLGAQFDVANEGQNSVDIWIDGSVNLLRPIDASTKREHGRFTITLAPGQRAEFRVEENRMLAAWAEAWQARQDGNHEPATVTAQVTCSDQFDDGVIDRWTLTAVCLPVEPKPNDLAAWTLRQSGGEPAIVTPLVGRLRRTYYLSKEQGVPLGTS